MIRRPSKRMFTELVVFTMLFGICLILANDLNFREGKPHGGGVFASDKSIYYVYLPATFIYGWDVQKFPSHCDTLYHGFILDYKRGKIINKMTCGVALMWTPFFLVTHAAAKAGGFETDGFSDFYQRVAILPPVFFLVLGLFFLKQFLRNYFSEAVACLLLLLILTGTNLYHYALAEGLMSHVHSFFLFSLFLFLVRKFLTGNMLSMKLFAAISGVAALAILVRPTNAVMMLSFFMLDASSGAELVHRIKRVFQPAYVITFVSIAFVVFLPQLLYWKYLSGHFFYYSYGGEGFVNWNNPVILPLLFSPFNGLLLYNPLVLLMIAGIILMLVRKIANGILLLFTFLLVVYLSGSWHMWFFGGSYGSRPFVEYYALFSLGLGYLLVSVLRLRNGFIRSLMILLMVIFSYYNLRLIYHNIWYTGSVWDWDAYKSRIDQAGLAHFSRESYTYLQDFENLNFEPALEKSNLRSHSLNWSGLAGSHHLYCGIFTRKLSDIVDTYPSKVQMNLWINPVSDDSTNMLLVAAIEDEKHVPWFYQSIPVNHFKTKTGEWRKVTTSFSVPGWLKSPDYRLNIYLWNVGRRSFYLDDIRVSFE